MKIGETIEYKGYDITKYLEDDYVVGIGHDTLEDAQSWIDRLIVKNELEEVTNESIAHL